MSQGELAEQTRLTHSYVRNIELGNEMPTLEILLRIAVSLKAEPWEMMLGPDAEGPVHPERLDDAPLSYLH